MAKLELTFSIAWPWWSKPLVAALVVASLVRLPLDYDRALRFLVDRAVFEAR